MLKKNRRKFFRLMAHHLLKYKVVGDEKTTGMLSFIRNISAGGVLFHSRDRLEPGKPLELEINFPFSSQSIKTFAKILRVKPLKRIGGFDIAVEFINLEEETKNLINERILNVYEKTKGGGIMKVLAIIFIILGLFSAAVALLIRFKLKIGLEIPFESSTWLNVTSICLLLSIALSLLRNK
jgi:hypothetical protein